jgi:methionyl-tRNA formyltransferase
LRVIFAGTPEFAQVALERLIRSGYAIPLVLTQPDRPAGRGMKLQASPVKQLAQREGIAVAQPHSLRLDGEYAVEAAAAKGAIEAANADALVVAAYGLILPQWALDSTPGGGLNIHASLLPRWRGAAPIHRAIEAGDKTTGVTIMQMDAGLDTGDMLLKASLPIDSQDTTASLHDKLAALGGSLIIQALQDLSADKLRPEVQPVQGASYADKIGKKEAFIDWTQSARLIERRVRAFNPFPVACAHLNREILKVWRAEVDDIASAINTKPGTIVAVSDKGIRVQCGDGILRLTELQRSGGRRMPVQEFLRGSPLEVGSVMHSTTTN